MEANKGIMESITITQLLKNNKLKVWEKENNQNEFIII